MIVFGLFGLIKILMDISKQGEREGKKGLLEKMYKNGDIDIRVYKKYL